MNDLLHDLLLVVLAWLLFTYLANMGNQPAKRKPNQEKATSSAPQGFY